MAASSSFVLKIDPSVKLSSKSRAEVTAAIGGTAAATLARLDLKGNLAFVPRVAWPGGIIIDLRRFISPDKLKELQNQKAR